MRPEEFERYVMEEVECAGGRSHGVALYGLVRWLRPRQVVEVGTCHGFTALWMGRALKENGAGELLCIDDFSMPGSSLEHVFYNLGAAGLGQVVTVQRGRSDEVAWPETDLAYIDGDHSLDGCRGDVERAIAAGARCVVVHDVEDWWGPRLWAHEFRSRVGWDLVEVDGDGGLAIALRQPEKGPLRHTESDFPRGCV